MEKHSESKNKSYLPFLAIVAIIAIVAVVVLVMNMKKESSSPVVDEEGNFVGEAYTRIQKVVRTPPITGSLFNLGSSSSCPTICHFFGRDNGRTVYICYPDESCGPSLS